MSVICQCPSCKARYQIGEQFAGRTVKCRKCSTAIIVPTPAPPEIPSAPASYEAAPDERTNDEPTGGEPAGAAADDRVSIPGLSDVLPTGGRPHPTKKKKKKGFPAWLTTTIVAAAAAAVAAIGSAIYLASHPLPHGAATSAPAVAADAKGGGKTESKQVVPVLTIDWPENQRAGAELFVDDKKREIPPTGPIEIELPPSNEQYHFRLARRGFQPKTFARASGKDDQGYIVSQWEPVTRGFDWPQDFATAKKAAAEAHKNVLIFFDASDSKESSFASSRFAEAVALRKEFHERAESEYVCVYIDNPQESDAQGRVENAERNRELTKQFGIDVFPTVLVTDAGGRPFGVLEGYKINGINSFLELLDKWEGDGKRLFELLSKIDSEPKDNVSSILAGRLLDFLEINGLNRFYRDRVAELTARLPTSDGRPVTNELAEMWLRRFALASRNPDEAKTVVAQFDEWKKSRVFADHDMGAALHLDAAMILGRLGPDLYKEAAQKCKEGLDFNPHDPRVRGLLEQLSQYLTTGESGGMPVGSGTGFCVAEGNYVLTNHHVIDGAKKIKAHLNGDMARYAAKLIADNATGDMALLKIDLPAGKELAPLPLAAAGVAIGEDVCALGFPSVMSQNSTVTFTKGVVSTVPDSHDEEGYIGTDCKVNPGNSGGPLCNFSGCIAGIVSAKSHISSREDSYGLVIPADRLRAFLVEKLPRASRKLPALSADAANLKADELGKKVAPSVVYIETIEEMGE